MKTDMSNLLPTHQKVTPLVLVNNGREIATVYTSNRREAARALADIVAAIEAVISKDIAS